MAENVTQPASPSIEIPGDVLIRNDTRFPYVIQCEQHKLANITIERLRGYPHARVEFSAGVTALEQFDDRVEIVVDGAAGPRRLSGSYLIGADGGRSTIRKALNSHSKAIPIPSVFWFSRPRSGSIPSTRSARAIIFPIRTNGARSSRSAVTMARASGVCCSPPA
jgi:2-polyprenyl-6-methoxyphenol hydroxylase-like FAD-dependent oxidoreductase